MRTEVLIVGMFHKDPTSKFLAINTKMPSYIPGPAMRQGQLALL